MDVEQVLQDEGGGQSQCLATLEKLDKVSQIFTNLASHIDSTLYADEDKREEYLVMGAAGDGAGPSQAVNKTHSTNSEAENFFGNSIDLSSKNNDLTSSSQSGGEFMSDHPAVTDVKTSNKHADTFHHHQKALPEGHQKKAPLRENPDGPIGTDSRKSGTSDLNQSSCELTVSETDIAKCLNVPKVESLELSNSSDSSRNNGEVISEVTNLKKKSKKKKASESDKAVDLPKCKTSTSASQDLMSQSRPVETAATKTDTFKSKVCSEGETQFTSVTHQPPAQSAGDTLPQSSEEYTGTPLFLPTNSHIRQPSVQPLAQQEVLMDADQGVYLLSAPTGWAQPSSHRIEPLGFPGASVHRTVPLFDTVNPPYGAANLNFPPNSFPGGANYFIGQNLYQPSLPNSGHALAVPHSGSFFNNYNISHIAQPMWPGTSTHHVPLVNSLAAGQFLPSRHGLLVQPPIITAASPSPEISDLVREIRRSSSNTSTGTNSNYDEEVAAVLHRQNNNQEITELQACLSSASVSGGSDGPSLSPMNLSDETHSFYEPNRPIASNKDAKACNAETFPHSHMQGEDSQQHGHTKSPTPSDKSSVSSGSRPKSKKLSMTQYFQRRKPKKIVDIPDDLKGIIKQALQEKDKQVHTLPAEDSKDSLTETTDSTPGSVLKQQKTSPTESKSF
ncbi:hypothetical protein ElyMa_001656000 [Elysia marginata]|uniref:Uncharacterized protein n=1 Tax=Elysia marginata TaxID=1093978 RepID=A0AAV4JU62_9GAST|nr:hypothetical protein ElyMa_001656000 [Elysia marginata]